MVESMHGATPQVRGGSVVLEVLKFFSSQRSFSRMKTRKTGASPTTVLPASQVKGFKI